MGSGGPWCQRLSWLERASSVHPGTVFVGTPSSLQGRGLYPEGPGHDPPPALPAICPDAGLGALPAHGGDMLDPSAAPKPWLVSLTLASPGDVSTPTGQLVPSHGLHFWMPPADTSMSVSIATLAEPVSTGESAPLGP